MTDWTISSQSRTQCSGSAPEGPNARSRDNKIMERRDSSEFQCTSRSRDCPSAPGEGQVKERNVGKLERNRRGSLIANAAGRDPDEVRAP